MINSGIQQIGIGVENVAEAWQWYRRHFGFDVPILEDRAPADLMNQYTGGQTYERHAVIALNRHGGGGLEIWQFTNRQPTPPPAPPAVGDLGIFAVRLKSADVAASRSAMVRNGTNVTALNSDPRHYPTFGVTDPFGQNFLVEAGGENWFVRPERGNIGGVSGCLIGVSDIEAARRLYTDVLGYDRVVYDRTGRFDDVNHLPGGKGQYRRVRLEASGHAGRFSELFGRAHLELWESLDRPARRLYEDRYWGDPGFIHVCFDITGMDELKRRANAADFPFQVDSAGSFQMGEAAGRFAYVEDPDGTLVELVETYRVPIAKRFGWHLDLGRYPAKQSLPRWQLRAITLNRRRD